MQSFKKLLKCPKILVRLHADENVKVPLANILPQCALNSSSQKIGQIAVIT